MSYEEAARAHGLRSIRLLMERSVLSKVSALSVQYM